MPSKPVFSDQVEQFTIVVQALLQNKETRAEFAKAPLATLKKYGVVFKDSAMAKKVEAELVGLAGSESMPNPDDPYPPYYFARTRTFPRTATFVRTASITWAVKPEGIDDLITIDQPRVDAFVTEVDLRAQIDALEARIAELEAKR